MAFTLIPDSGQISFSEVAQEFSVQGPLTVSDFRGIQTVPATGPIDVSDFYSLNGNPTQYLQYISGHYERNLKGGTTIVWGVGQPQGYTVIQAGSWIGSNVDLYGQPWFLIGFPTIVGSGNNVPNGITVYVDGFTADPGQDYVQAIRVTRDDYGSWIESSSVGNYAYEGLAPGRAVWDFNAVTTDVTNGPLPGAGVPTTAEIILG